MTVPTYPGLPAPAPRRRPTIVTAASNLLYFVAALEVVTAIITFSLYGKTYDAVKSVYAGTAAEGMEGVVAAASSIGAAINVLLAIGLATLGFLDGRGKNAARIVTWVIGGISLCCVGLGLGGNAMVSSMNSTSTTGGPSQTEVQQRIDAALPSWYRPFSVTLSVVMLLAMLAVIILLALPASNEFFRKQPAGYDPSLAYPAYPGGQPPYPGQPAYGSQPAQPQYPGQSPYPSQPQPGPFGQPGQPAPGLPPYPGQATQPPSDPYAAPPPASDPFAAPPPPSDPYAAPPSPGPETPGEQPHRPPTDPA